MHNRLFFPFFVKKSFHIPCIPLENPPTPADPTRCRWSKTAGCRGSQSIQEFGCSLDRKMGEFCSVVVLETGGSTSRKLFFKPSSCLRSDSDSRERITQLWWRGRQRIKLEPTLWLIQQRLLEIHLSVALLAVYRSVLTQTRLDCIENSLWLPKPLICFLRRSRAYWKTKSSVLFYCTVQRIYSMHLHHNAESIPCKCIIDHTPQVTIGPASSMQIFWPIPGWLYVFSDPSAVHAPMFSKRESVSELYSAGDAEVEVFSSDRSLPSLTSLPLVFRNGQL